MNGEELGGGKARRRGNSDAGKREEKKARTIYSRSLGSDGIPVDMCLNTQKFSSSITRCILYSLVQGLPSSVL
jgi:hypothetical protein